VDVYGERGVKEEQDPHGRGSKELRGKKKGGFESNGGRKGTKNQIQNFRMNSRIKRGTSRKSKKRGVGQM